MAGYGAVHLTDSSAQVTEERASVTKEGVAAGGGGGIGGKCDDGAGKGDDGRGKGGVEGIAGGGGKHRGAVFSDMRPCLHYTIPFLSAKVRFHL